jgi:beta-N-acetylhexosaminidase
VTPSRRGIAALVCAALVAATWAVPAAADDTASPDIGTPTGTVVVQAAAADDLAAEAAARVAAMTTRQKAASVVMGHIPTTDVASLRGYMESTGIGGFILMGANIPGSEARLRELTAALTIDAALPPLLAIDQEGGDVSRLPWDDFPSSVTLKDEAPSAAQLAFAGRAALVQRAGIGVNFGIVADVTDDRSMFIYRRALGTTPEAGAERVVAAVTGEGSGAYSTLKHFPGHGAAPGDSHAGIPSTGMSKAEWASTDGLPFAAGIDADAPFLMYGHLAYTAVDAAPASLSAEWHRIARDELGFAGVAITDDLGMLQASGIPAYRDPVANAVTAIAAGNDMVLAVLFSTYDSANRIVSGIASAADAGTIPMARLDEAAERVMLMRLELAAAGRGLMPCATCEPVG